MAATLGEATMTFHEPVLVAEVMELLAPGAGMTVVDGTLGTGGHGRLLAEAIGPEGRLLGLDRDPAMLATGRERLEGEFAAGGPAMAFAARPYEEVSAALEEAGFPAPDRVLLDVGVNSLHLDLAERGFSFSADGPLDGRFNPDDPSVPTMAEVVNGMEEGELARLLRELGDERYCRRVARRIVERRSRGRLETTGQLADAVRSAYPAGERDGRIHPATRTFQALRIHVNDELGHLERGLGACLDALAPGGRLAVITFHSGEARVVKRVFRERSEAMRDAFGREAAPAVYTWMRPRNTRCSEAEAGANSRARSAVLRVIERRGGVGQ